MTKKALVSAIMVLCVLALPQSARAQKIEELNAKSIFDFVISQDVLDINDDDTFKAYMMLNECDVFQNTYEDDFEWTKLRETLAPVIAEQQSGQSRFYLDDVVRLSRYNFNTQSYDLPESSTQVNANTLAQLGEVDFSYASPCTRMQQTSALPRETELRLNTPLSLYRIPMSEGLASRIISYNREMGYEDRGLFTRIYITLDSAAYSWDSEKKIAGMLTLFGNIDKIDFFLDEERRRKVKTLDYTY